MGDSGAVCTIQQAMFHARAGNYDDHQRSNFLDAIRRVNTDGLLRLVKVEDLDLIPEDDHRALWDELQSRSGGKQLERYLGEGIGVNLYYVLEARYGEKETLFSKK